MNTVPDRRNSIAHLLFHSFGVFDFNKLHIYKFISDSRVLYNSLGLLYCNISTRSSHTCTCDVAESKSGIEILPYYAVPDLFLTERTKKVGPIS